MSKLGGVLEAMANPDEAVRLAAMRKAKHAPVMLKAHLARFLLTDPSRAVRDEVHGALLRSNDAIRASVMSALGKALATAAEPEVLRALEGIETLAENTKLPPSEVFAPLLASRSVAVRAATLRCLRPEMSRAFATALVEALDDTQAEIRSAALQAIHRGTFSPSSQVLGGFLAGLSRALRDGNSQDVERALRLAIQLGARARPLALEIVTVLGKSKDDPEVFAKALEAIGDLPAETRRPLEALARSTRSDVAQIASDLLSLAFGAEVPVAEIVEQLRRDLASSERDTRLTAIYAAEKHGPRVAVLIPDLIDHGTAIANDRSRPSRTELSSVRDALTAMGCRAQDLPHPRSVLEVIEGTVPTPGEAANGYVIGEVVRTVAGRRKQAHGVWEQASGRLAFLVENAELMAHVPGQAEVAVIRREPARRPGGGGRGGLDWHFERYAVPAGTKLTSLSIGEPYTFGNAGSLRVDRRKDGNAYATFYIADEDRPGTLIIELGTGEAPDAIRPKGSAKARAKPATAASTEPRKPTSGRRRSVT